MNLPNLFEIAGMYRYFFLINGDDLNFYTIYRWGMLGITLFNVFNVMVSILKYKKYFDRLPFFLKRYLKTKTTKILGSKLTDNHREIWINLGLLGILIGLNITLFLI